MATTPNSEPPKAQSRAIRAGAELFIALFDAEKAKVAAACNQTLRDLEARLSAVQQNSRASHAIDAHSHAEPTLATPYAQAADADGSLGQEQISDVQRELTRVNHPKEFSNVQFLPQHHNSTSNLSPEQASDNARAPPKDMQDAEVQADDLYLLVSVGELRRDLMVTKQLLAEKEQNCKVIEKERDDLKAAMEKEVMMLKDRMLSLQKEVDTLKGSPSRSQADSSNKKAVAIGAGISESLRSLRFTVPREKVPQQDTIQPSKPLPVVAPKNDLAVTTTSSTIAAVAFETSDSSTEIVQKDDDRPSAKRPVSASTFSSLEPNIKRVKRDHVSHDNSPPTMPKDPALPATDRKYSSENSVSPANASPFLSNASGGEASPMKLLIKSLKSETPIQTTASASANHSERSTSNKSHNLPPRILSKETGALPSRPKPRPAYRGRPITSPPLTTTNGIDTKNVPASEYLSSSEPKP